MNKYLISIWFSKEVINITDELSKEFFGRTHILIIKFSHNSIPPKS